jgi:hypothetical protein
VQICHCRIADNYLQKILICNALGGDVKITLINEAISADINAADRNNEITADTREAVKVKNLPFSVGIFCDLGPICIGGITESIGFKIHRRIVLDLVLFGNGRKPFDSIKEQFPLGFSKERYTVFCKSKAVIDTVQGTADKQACAVQVASTVPATQTGIPIELPFCALVGL